jgi:D-arabinan endo alpha-(1,5)-arabinofuranosidase
VRRTTAVAATTFALALGAAGGAQGAVDRSDTYEIAQLTGPEGINATHERWNVFGTDLGSMFEFRGRTYMAFGDTFGPPGHPPEFGDDWRSSAMAFTRDRDPRDGLTFEGMIEDRPGHAKELILDEQVPGEEVTVIPTYGTSVGKRMYLHYMAVSFWGPPGEWDLSQSGWAYSDDEGQTWTVSPDAVWPGGGNFGQVAVVERGRHVYLYGIPGGRFGHVELARVDRHSLLDLDRYTYWDGRGWVSDPERAAEVVPAPVGELSVRWNSHYRKWLMMYLDDARDEVVLRTADRLEGPWSEAETVVTAAEVPTLYAPYMPPRFNHGRDIYFALSKFDTYDVFWWHTSLEEE